MSAVVFISSLVSAACDAASVCLSVCGCVPQVVLRLRPQSEVVPSELCSGCALRVRFCPQSLVEIVPSELCRGFALRVVLRYCPQSEVLSSELC